MKTALLAAGAALVCATFAIVSAPRAEASTFVIGGGMAHDCSVIAIEGGSNLAAIEICTLALEVEALQRSDRAKTLINRGVVYLRRGAFSLCAKDLDRAEKLDASIGELYINRGVLMIRDHRYAEALVEINRGIALNPDELEKAYYNRGLANELSNNFQAAYVDYRKANSIKPDWPDAAKAMSRFTTKPSGT